ncbi:hypothetical protein [Bathymodiolus japonicus methanotrophic gill symbiont]|uniref:hypothetical protein n=1 Tax=Bathymodiolus japonicus methanotrophic gill symbiont TaxID=113269 RepID=UPI001C8D2422|nr:hypothetical protein [Bathymodiolus japonicus methanotrophic gill symbiont]
MLNTGLTHYPFLNTQLGQNATVFFDRATFGKGGVSFRYSEVVNGDISFSEVVFGEGEVSFSNAKFGNGQVNFSDAKFGNGRVDFTSAELGNRKVTFDKAEFGDRGVCFCDVDFCKTNTNTINGVVTFKEVTFGKGAVDFEHAKFGKGTVNFYKSSFGDGDVNFKDAKFGEGNVFFDSCEFKGNISFRELQDVKKLSSFSLRNSIFNKSLDMPDNIFNCIPDLTNTKLTNQVSLDRMEISDNYPPKGNFDKSDGGRLCRLKELAEANKNHQQALDFHVIEMRAKRYNTKLIKGKTPHMLLDILFDIACLYGQSIIRPVLSLIVLTIVCACIYAYESSLDYFPFCYGLLYSLSQVFSFVPAGRSITIGILDKLFPCETIIPDVVYFFSLLQGVLSSVLLFLILDVQVFSYNWAKKSKFFRLCFISD